MLEHLRIENFAIIEHLNVDFVNGMNVIVGQTGAGKTIIIEALELLIGKRAEFSKVKDESKKAVVEASFLFDEEFINQHIYLNDYLEDNRLIVTRILTPSKQSQVRINGEIVSINILKKLMENVIDIFSQGDASFLFNPVTQLNLIDEFSLDENLKVQKENYQKAYFSYQSKLKEIDEFKKTNEMNMLDYYQFQVKEIESYHLKENEIEDLNYQKENLSTYETLENDFDEFNKFCYNSQFSIKDVLDSLLNRIERLKNSQLASQANQAYQDILSLENSLDELFNEHDKLDFSIENLDRINSRLFELTTLTRKYGKSTNEILSALNNFKAKLEQIENYDTILKQKEEELNNLISNLTLQAEKLTKLRQQAARELEKEVNSQLDDLGLLKDGFKIEFGKVDFSNLGQDKVAYKVALNKGGKFLELKNAVSGGENSRLNLALKVVFNKAKVNDTLIFDEIDTGISGEIAFKAAKKMFEISKSSSIIVITHLVQVLSFADQGFIVYKKEEQGITSSHIQAISKEQLIEQMALIISNNKLSPASLQASNELYNEAQKYKSKYKN